MEERGTERVLYGVMQRIAKPVPKPCFGVEFDLSTDICRTCAVQAACYESLGARKDKITLNKVVFKLVPEAYGVEDMMVMGEDPELPHIERTYALCHHTVYGTKPKDRIGKHKNLVLERYHASGCSLRLFFLANMVAQQQAEITISEKMQRAPRNSYSAVLLTYESALQRVSDYRALCRKEFGSFDLGSLATLASDDYGANDIETKMKHSEITAARVFVNYKLRNGGPGIEQLYAAEELALDPFWLATEPSYIEHVLKPHLAGKKGTKTINGHRYSVTQVIAQMKKNKDWAIAVFQARERIMPAAVSEVLNFFGFVPSDFETDQEPVTQVMDFWVLVARAVQHVNCIRYVEGDYSAFQA